MSNLLDRRLSFALPSNPAHNLTSSQRKTDELLSSFLVQASDWKNLSAMTAGSFAYRLSKMGVTRIVGIYGRAPLLAKSLSPTLGLALEVTAFRGTHSLLTSSHFPLSSSSWFTDYVHFGSLKFFGHLSQGQNPIFAHALQDSGMVAGHHLAFGLGLATAPEGNLVQQLLHAEMTNLSMAAGLSLAHHLSSGKILRSEKNLDLRLQALSLHPKILQQSPSALVTWSSEKKTDEPKQANAPANIRTDGQSAPSTVDTAGDTQIRGIEVKADLSVENTVLRNPEGTLLSTPPPQTTAAQTHPTAISTQMTLGPGGRFKVVKILGSGGFGDVYQVYDQTLERMAVIKIPKEDRNSKELLKRFDREIKIGANLDPRYSVAVYDMVEIQHGLKVPVMEFVPGHDLSTLIQGSPVDPLRKIEIFAEICEAIESAHRRGILHRDLKPENIRITKDGHVRIMDWGIATSFNDVSPGLEHSAHHLVFQGSKLTQRGSWAGTIGYVAPEIMEGRAVKNPPSPDIFALGVILWEMMAGHHPFIAYDVGSSPGGPAKVPAHSQEPKAHLGVYASAIGPALVPSLREVIAGDFPNYLYEIETIAKKAFSPDPKNRYQSVQELREDVLMAFARAERSQISEIQESMKGIEQKMHEAWKLFQVGEQIPLGQWEAMHQPIAELREMRASWKQKAQDLIKYLEITFRGRLPDEAKKMIAELCWRILIDEGDTISLRERQSLEKNIRTYDVATPEDPLTSMKDALEGNVEIQVVIRDRDSGQSGYPHMTRIRLLKYFQDRNAAGIPLLSYQSREIFDASLRKLKQEATDQKIMLNEGYYVFEITHAGYATIRIPVHISLGDIREYLQSQRALTVTADLVSSHQVPKNMSVVQGGKAWTGMDYFTDPNPLDKHSFPLQRVEFETFAITRYPITVSQYEEFLQAQLNKVNTELERKDYREAAELLLKVRQYLPRGQLHLDPMDKLLQLPTPEMIAQAFNGVKYNWRVHAVGEGERLRFALQDPTTHRSAANEEILAEQPIHAIPMIAIQAYIDWRNTQEGRNENTGMYRLPERRELEIIARNSFPWPYPWGYVFDPNFLESRLIHSDVNQGAVAKPVGSHSRGRNFYRDFSAFDVYDLLGNTRKITQTPAEKGCVYCFGGSVRTPFGPYFLPSALLYAGANTVNEYNSSFYLVISLPQKKRP